MRYELFLAIRNLRSRRRRRLAQVTALAAVIGIAVGVAALIITLALANGFRDEMRDKILRGTAHLNVLRTNGQPITDYKKVVTRIKSIGGVSDAGATTYDGAVVNGPKGPTYAVLRGLEPDSVSGRAELQRLLIEGSSSPIFEPVEGNLREVVLGSELAQRAGVKVGEVIEIVSANTAASSTTPIRKLVRVAGLFRSGLFEYDSTWIYMSLDLATVLTGTIDRVSVISVQVRDIYNVKQVAVEVRKTLGADYATIDWQEANRPLFTALALERRMGLVIISLIIFIAALNITATLIVLVIERRQEIAILSAMGATSRSVMKVFVFEGAFIGLIGAMSGVMIGVISCAIGNGFKLVSLPADVYSISTVPFNVRISDVLLAFGVALILSLIATIYPARAASQMKPIPAIRDAY